MRLAVSGRTAVVLLGLASRICSKQHTVHLCSSHVVFSPSIRLKFNSTDTINTVQVVIGSDVYF